MANQTNVLKSFVSIVDIHGLKHSVNLANVTHIYFEERNLTTIKFVNETDINFDLTKHPLLLKLFHKVAL